MNKLILLVVTMIFVTTTAFNPADTKLITKSGHINFFSHTIAEDISSDNYKVTSTLDVATGVIVFSVPMQSFEFE
ncbi:MAG: YceI family protein, partial [Bacteroidetes bacterium]|nr:YceI family protein [Bacteroidota bacterium]